MSTSPLMVPAIPPPLESPGSCTSSTNLSGAPLTPFDEELDKSVGTMSISDVEGDGDRDSDSREGTASTSFAKAANKPQQMELSPFAGFSFGSQPTAHEHQHTRADSFSPNDISMPTEGFTFGTCSAKPFLGTPTAEQGPFEYPNQGPSSIAGPSSPKKAPLALGQTHRRGSIVVHSTPVLPSPPSTRRSSTCSTIVTVPVAGRRPSILHSATAENGLPIPLASLTLPPGPSSTSTSSASLTHNARRTSLMFQQKTLPAPIPPSLLARRGSVPAAQLFGLPVNEQPRPRASYSAGGYTTTSAALYRRQSMASESGVSSGSGRTVVEGDDYGRRLSTRSVHTPLMSGGGGDFDHGAYGQDRRPSLPFAPSFASSSSSSRHTPSRQSFSAHGPLSRTSFSRTSLTYQSPSSPKTGRNDSLASTSSSTSTSTSTSMSSTTSSSSSPVSKYDRRMRQSSSLLSNLSSSEESNEDEDDDEEPLPTPSGSAFVSTNGKLPPGPTFLDPWASSGRGTGGTIEHSDGVASGKVEEAMAMGPNIPMETPPLPISLPSTLQTVEERPTLESIDSDRTERA